MMAGNGKTGLFDPHLGWVRFPSLPPFSQLHKGVTDMATTNSKKRKLSMNTLLVLVLRIIPIILDGLNKPTEGNLNVADVQFQFNTDTGKVTTFTNNGKKQDVKRVATETGKSL